MSEVWPEDYHDWDSAGLKFRNDPIAVSPDPLHVSDRPSASHRVRRLRAGAARAAVVVAIPYVLIISMLAFIQRSLIYQPRRELVGVPADAFVEGQLHEVHVRAHDGVTLHGWLALADASAAGTPLRDSLSSPRPLVVYFSGNAGHRGYRVRKIAMFNRLGSDVLIVDYRGYAENAGSPSEWALARDAQSVWDFATTELNVPAGRIVLCGESLGGGVAVRLAHDLCVSGIEPAGLMLRATFSSLVDAAAWHYPWLPVRWVMIDRYPSLHRIPRVTCPLLVIHGHQDRIIPFEQGVRLFDAAPEMSTSGVEKRLLELPQADHNDIMYVAGDVVEAATGEFLQTLQALAQSVAAVSESSAIGE